MNEKEKKQMGLRIKKLREEKGLTQDELAEMLGMKRTNIANYEAGRVIPPGNVLRDLADIFAVSTDYLLGRETSGEVYTIAAHHDGEWTEEELEEIERFKEFVKSKRRNQE
ncbi:helix-turn-helix domain-containing protein [Paenibacillus larvae]|uniref:helix-turn-helix domain-containing protein n=1 Tax=Paenibacillus larvae TaxID=1464 RepID=UPI0001F85D15|nr:helix-turn-helix transcriptional regulator [Paenibacillus larvae]PCK71246.1 transcriptional regulator-like protein [Paenibacillus larvae subsp. larvae B-3650]